METCPECGERFEVPPDRTPVCPRCGAGAPGDDPVGGDRAEEAPSAQHPAWWSAEGGPQIPEYLPERARTLLEDLSARAFRLFFFLTPFMLIGLLVGISFLVYPVRTNELWGAYFIYFVPPAGKESVVPLMVGQGFDPLFVGFAIMTLDVAGSLFVFGGWEYFVKIPLLGPVLAGFSDRVSDFAEGRRGVQGAKSVFLFFLVMFPLQGSGGITAALLSRVFGMKMLHALIAIAAGALTGALLIAYSANFIAQWFGPEVLLIGVAVILTIVGLRYAWTLRQRAEEE